MGFTLTTFGSCHLRDDADQLVRVPERSLILLAYLYDAGSAMKRRDLATALWPGCPEVAATNLRSTLRRLSLATSDQDCSLLTSVGSTLSISAGAMTCDLDLVDRSDARDRLHVATDGVAKQFLPLLGDSDSVLDAWVRDVRIRAAGRLRSEFFRVHAAADAGSVRSDLKRAGILLLERDPHDEEVRKALALSSEYPQRPHVRPIHATAIDASVPQPPASTITALPPAPSLPPRIALLPPETLQDAQQSGSVANALVEDLTIGLCASRAVSVVAPYTAERIQSARDKAAVLQQHQVVYALDTKRSGDRLFVQLIFTPTDEIVWAKRFQLSARAISDQRLEISEAIQAMILDRIGAAAAPLEDFRQKPEAYFSYLRGLQSLSSLSLPSIRKARKQFREALDHDKSFSAALSGISRTLTMEWVLTARGDNDLLRQAETLANASIRENDMFAGGHKELGVSLLYMGKIDDSLDALSKAEAVSPQYADILYSHADSLVHASEPQTALDKITSAIALNPISPDTYFWTAAGASYFLGEYEQALGYIDRMQDGNPASRLAAASWGMLGDSTKARTCRLRVLKSNPDFDLERWLSMIPHKEPWQTELYREGLVKAGF